MPKDLLFVNKTQSSDLLTRSQAREKAKILSHVQNNRRKAESESGERKAWSTFTSVMTPSSSEDLRETDQQQAKRKSKPRKKTKPRLSAAVMASESSSSLSPESAVIWLPTTVPSNNASDPFHCTSVQLDAGSHALLRGTFYLASRPNFLAESFAPASVVVIHRTAAMRHDDIFRKRLKRCVEDPTLMYATLAYSSSFLGWTIGCLPEGADPNKPAEYFLGKALHEVRMRLSAPSDSLPVDTWFVLSIYALAIIELWNGVPAMWAKFPEKQAFVFQTRKSRLAACRLHMNALLHVVTENGGWEMFDDYVLDSTLLADKYLSIIDLQPPIIPLTWDPGPAPEGMIQKALGTTAGQCVGGEALPQLGTNLLSVPALDERVKNVVRDLIEYARFAHIAWLKPIVSAEVETWLFRRLQALTHRLLVLALSSPDLPDAVQSPQDCIACITALIAVLSGTPHDGPRMGAGYLGLHLKDLLTSENGSCRILDAEGFNDGLRLWCLCTGAMMPEKRQEEGWFIDKLTEYYPWNQLTEENLQVQLESFLYLPLKQGFHLAAMIDSLHARMAAVSGHSTASTFMWGEY
ncbi:hypothetical protein B0H63DRAFT_472602 [Podospora didyma]|uniref:Uncharacterized protein n=1 Tax=Podospora didyma TaxID=330526 RepID=A0AAE0NPD2_9PEZI|nr:hypothetical protein B0H63DRAFT_472602 [Podospora didyma]